ncbi:transposon Ty3-I Gag-Pol polyprotein [Trichonephila clavipes]|nr:transposon Ty3-I Gag-Pol polyprotein [Trichonephila clavipes]
MNDSKTEIPLSVDQESQLSRIAFKAPAFWENDPGLWFFQVESQFLLAGISNDSTKFHAVIAALNSNILSCVRDLVKNPHKERKVRIPPLRIRSCNISRNQMHLD